MEFLSPLLKIRLKPNFRVFVGGLFSRRSDRLRTIKRCRCTSVDIFSVSGVWEDELTVDKLKCIENYWNGKISQNEYKPYVENDSKQSMYILSMFPYPSGKLHMGHVRVYTLSDTLARFYRMRGVNVIHPIGWDAFGLPAENAAIDKGAQPAQWTMNNIAAMKNQLLELGFSFDWEREFATCDPSYYHWTQFLFLQLFHKGYAYRRQALVNWDPVDQTVLADEQVDENGCSWRSGAQVEKKSLKQWFIKTTAFSQALYDGLSHPGLKRWKDVIDMQKNWIGECNGFIIELPLVHDGNYLDERISVWMEKPELMYGTSFITVASDHILNSGRDKLDVVAVNPLTKDLIPIFVDDESDIVRSMDSHVGIPCVSLEDRTFAEKHGLAVTNVLEERGNMPQVLCNSQELSGLPCLVARKEICRKIKDMGITCFPSSRNLRDWLISRQRYWGTPIPIIHCKNCGVVPVPFQELPITLPDVQVFGKGGISPLVSAKDWVNTKCPKCGNDAKRETDTMDTFVDSSWYYLRYLDAKNSEVPFDPIKAWKAMPVDLYIGGKEHAVMHLYYARFMSHFCHSLGYLKHPEPFSKLLVQGLVTAESYRLENSGGYVKKEDVDFSGKTPVAKGSGERIIIQWEKMSKSKYNGVDAKDIVQEYGADLLRMCMMANYSPHSQRKWMPSEFPPLIKWKKKLWQTIKEFKQQKEGRYNAKPVSEEEQRKFETEIRENRNSFVRSITHQMDILNDLRDVVNKLKTMSSTIRNAPKSMWGDCHEFERMLASLIIMLAPITPHFASELWAGFVSVAEASSSYDIKLPVLFQRWPQIDDDFLLDFVVQVNGTVATQEKIAYGESALLTDVSALEKALAMEKLKHIDRDKIKDFIYNSDTPNNSIEMNLTVSD